MPLDPQSHKVAVEQGGVAAAVGSGTGDHCGLCQVLAFPQWLHIWNQETLALELTEGEIPGTI